MLFLVRGRRGKSEIIIDILEEALEGANKTRIMYRANLNFLRFDRYFGELSEKGLIEVVDDPDRSVIYKTTERGRELLKVLREAEKLLSL